MSAHERAVEAREIVGILQTSKFAVLVDVMQREPDCFTHGGRLNCAAVSRHLGTSDAAVRAMVQEMRGMTGCA
jgi:hypothetical protein